MSLSSNCRICGSVANFHLPKPIASSSFWAFRLNYDAISDKIVCGLEWNSKSTGEARKTTESLHLDYIMGYERKCFILRSPWFFFFCYTWSFLLGKQCLYLFLKSATQRLRDKWRGQGEVERGWKGLMFIFLKFLLNGS